MFLRVLRRMLAAGCLAGIGVGCVQPVDLTEAKSVEALRQKRIEFQKEWRTASQVGPSDQCVIGLGAASATDAVFRVGILEREWRGARPLLRVFLEEREVDRLRAGASSRWGDYRLDLPAADKPGSRYYLAVDAETSVWLAPCEVVSGEPTQPNVLIVLIDTLRLDHLGCYGYARDTSPHIDAFARDAVTFTQLMPQSSWTKPSVGSLLTSVYPQVHGAEDRPDVLREGLPSIATELARHGYACQGLVTNANILPLFGFGAGFERFVDVDASDTVNCDDAKVIDKAIAAAAHLDGRPWFLYVHLMGPHDPYDPPHGYGAKFRQDAYPDTEAGKRQSAVDLYDGEIRYSDAQVGRLLQALRAQGQYDNTVIIVVSDHGEEFWEHGGTGHGKTLYEEVLRVPLLIKLPNSAQAGTRSGTLVEMIDLAPTVLELAGCAPTAQFAGTSFSALLQGGEVPGEPGYASLVNLDKSIRTAKTIERKYIHNVAAHWERWYNLREDPLEQHPVEAPDALMQSLAVLTRGVAVRGSQGLHILMTCGNAPRRVVGTLRGPALGAHEVDYYDWKNETTREGGALTFSWQTHHANDATFERKLWHGRLAEQDNAHLRADLPADAEFTLSIQVDGEPAPPEVVHLGQDGAALGAEPLKPLDLLAGPDQFDPAGLPREFGIYVWYVADTGKLNPENIKGETRQVLEALGYL